MVGTKAGNSQLIIWNPHTNALFAHGNPAAGRVLAPHPQHRPRCPRTQPQGFPCCTQGKFTPPRPKASHIPPSPKARLQVFREKLFSPRAHWNHARCIRRSLGSQTAKARVAF